MERKTLRSETRPVKILNELNARRSKKKNYKIISYRTRTKNTNNDDETMSQRRATTRTQTRRNAALDRRSRTEAVS